MTLINPTNLGLGILAIGQDNQFYLLTQIYFSIWHLGNTALGCLSCLFWMRRKTDCHLAEISSGLDEDPADQYMWFVIELCHKLTSLQSFCKPNLSIFFPMPEKVWHIYLLFVNLIPEEALGRTWYDGVHGHSPLEDMVKYNLHLVVVIVLYLRGQIQYITMITYMYTHLWFV